MRRTRHSSRPLGVRALWAIAMLSLLAACSRPEPPAEPVRAVKVLKVGEASFNSTHEYAGEVKARVESRLGFRVPGKIVKRLVEPGQHVKAGQTLAQLDDSDYRLAAEASHAQVTAATTQRDLAAADFKRYASLREQNFISAAELERRDATLRSAQATLAQAQAQSAAQGHQTGYALLVADAAGVVTAVEAEVGQVVAAGTPVVRIAQDGPRDVVFAVPEDRLLRLPVGAPVAVRVWSGGADLTGSVREVAASADPATRTFPVKVALAVPESANGQGAPALGSTVYVQPAASPAAGQRQSVIKLPTSALRQEGKGTAVWVLDPVSMTVRSQPVQVTTADGNEAVIDAGLTAGQLVVSAGVHVLSPGQKVSIYESKKAVASVKQSMVASQSGAKKEATASAAAPAPLPVAPSASAAR